MTLDPEQKKKLDIAKRFLFVTLVLFPLLCAATYTWFTLSQVPSVHEMEYSVSSGTGLELAFAPDSPDEEWGQYLDFADQPLESTSLKPVTWSENDQCFYAADYGIDGRISGISRKLNDAANANRSDSIGYYVKRTFYARSGVTVDVSLAEALVGADGTEGSGTYLIGTPVWDAEKIAHEEGGQGFEYAVRVGIRITNMETDSSVFYIYEPNCDGHVIRSDSGDVELYMEKDTQEEAIDYQTPSIDGTDTLVPEDRLIRQTTSSWKEAYPVQRKVVVQELGKFLTDPWLFELGADEMAQIDLYIWLEGQDPDCTSLIGQDAQLFMNIQLEAEAQTGSGLELIH